MIDFITFLFRGPPPRPHPSLDTELSGPRLTLRRLVAEQWGAWRTLRAASREYLEPWEPTWPERALTYGFYCSLLRRHWRDWRRGRAFAFGIFLRQEERMVLVGGITLGDVQFAAAQKGTIGYWMGLPYAGQGFMTEAVALVCDFAFKELRLQRVEASCLPRNDASKTVLQRCGFDQEGYAKAYLQVNGKREDHLLWGKNKPVEPNMRGIL